MQDKFFDAGPTDPLLNARLTQMIAAIKSTLPLSSLSSVSNVGYTVGNDLINITPSNPVCPPAAVWTFGTSALVLISGMKGNEQVNALLAGWSDRPNPASIFGINPAFEQGAISILAGFPVTLRNKSRYFIVGHSYGGGVACALARMLANQNPSPPMMVITYGSPRVGNFRGAETVARLGVTRFHIPQDPVPSIPPHRAECPSLAAILSRPSLAGWSSQVQAPTGWRLEADGTISQREDYGATVPNVWLDVATYIMGGEGFTAPNHSIATYNQCFLAGIPATPPVPPKPLPTLPEAMETIRPREYQHYVEIGEAAVFADTSNPVGATRNYAPPPVQDLAAPHYRAARDGNLWVVKLGTIIVGGARGKRQAKKLARTWNRSARAAL